jgi:hypothetical protein
MAVTQVLMASWVSSPSIVPHMFGWKLRGPDLECEVDIVVVRREGGLPVVIVGEAKHHRDSIDAIDLANLGKVQEHIRSKRIECFILVGVLRELRSDEVDIIRAFADRPPKTLSFGSTVEPVLPIVLTEVDLSAHSFEDHPMRWDPAGGTSGLAKGSCSRNLGFRDVEFAAADDDWRYKYLWA